MIYATRATIVAIYGAEFATELLPEDVADPAGAVDRALSQASAEIDGYLSARYDLPLPTAPRVLERPCIDIAIYILAHSHTRLTVTIEDRNKQATDFLTKIGIGKAGLGADEPRVQVEGAADVSASDGAAFSANQRRFRRR